MLCVMLESLFALATVLISPLDQGEPSPKLQLSYAYAVDEGEIRGERLDEKCVAMSTFKVYVALALLHAVDEQKSKLDDMVLIPKEEWEQETWSPLQKTYRGKDASLSLRRLLHEMLINSDNIATDAIITHLGGIKGLNAVLRDMSVSFIPFETMEKQMQLSKEAAAANRIRPRDFIMTLRALRQGKLLSSASTALLIEHMQACQTGKEKIRAQFPHALVGNRSGASGRDAAGTKLADNDVGFVLLPDGRCLYIAIFISHSKESDKKHTELIQKLCSALLNATQERG